jgi:HTH-type transcriptional regulator, sugar sensing transcriptional regulator
MDKFEALETFGLNQKEAKIYVKLLELGEASASEIAKKVDILRPTVYDILDNMIKKGIVTYSIESGRKVFAAVNPGVLKEILISRKELIEQFLPELESISKISKVKPLVETYVGSKGIKSIFDDILNDEEDLYHIFNYEEYTKLFQQFFIKNFIKKRVEKKIRFHAIVNHIDDPELAKSDTTNLREIRTLQTLEKFKATMFFYGDKCGFLSFAETPVGVVIENSIMTSSMKVLFDFMWKQADK